MTTPFYVDPNVSQKKFQVEVEKLLNIGSTLRKRGWIIEQYKFPYIRITFLCSNLNPSIAPFTVEVDFTNYNLLPLTVGFLHPITFKPVTPNGVQLLNGIPRPIIVQAHPETKKPFLCLPGIREYHSHPEHTGDSWDLYRYTNEGSLYNILENIWKYCVRTINSYNLNINIPIVNVMMEALP